MTCRDRILSEDYITLVTDFRLSPEIMELTDSGVDYCYHALNGEYGIFYLNADALPSLSLSNYMYRYIPQIYGLMNLEMTQTAGVRFDPQPLEAAGILRVQREPLALTGRGVIMAFIDTGQHVR